MRLSDGSRVNCAATPLERQGSDFPPPARTYLDGALKLDAQISCRIALHDINPGFAALPRGETIRSVAMFQGDTNAIAG